MEKRKQDQCREASRHERQPSHSWIHECQCHVPPTSTSVSSSSFSSSVRPRFSTFLFFLFLSSPVLSLPATAWSIDTVAPTEEVRSGTEKVTNTAVSTAEKNFLPPYQNTAIIENDSLTLPSHSEDGRRVHFVNATTHTDEEEQKEQEEDILKGEREDVFEAVNPSFPFPLTSQATVETVADRSSLPNDDHPSSVDIPHSVLPSSASATTLFPLSYGFETPSKEEDKESETRKEDAPDSPHHTPSSFASVASVSQEPEERILFPVLENEVLSISLILGYHEGDTECTVHQGESLATMLKNGDIGGILKSLVGVTTEFSRRPSPFHFFRFLTPSSRAASSSRAFTSLSETRLAAVSPEHGRVDGTGGVNEVREAEEAKEGGHVEEGTTASSSVEERNADGEGKEEKGSPVNLNETKGAEEETVFAIPGSSRDASSSMPRVDENETEVAVSTQDGMEHRGREGETGGREEKKKEEETRVTVDEIASVSHEFQSAQKRPRHLNTAQRLLRFFTSFKKDNLGSAVCRALTEPTLNARAFCSLLNVVKNEMICNYRAIDCSMISSNRLMIRHQTRPPSASDADNKAVNVSPRSASEHLFIPITVPEPSTKKTSSHFAFPSSTSILDLPLLSLHSLRSYTSSTSSSSTSSFSVTDIPKEIVDAEGPTYALVWEGMRRLYDYFELRVCEELASSRSPVSGSVNIEVNRVKTSYRFSPPPAFLPGWETEMILNAVQPGATPRSPLAVISRRGKTVMILIRGTQTQFEWALNAQYELTFGWNDMWDGKVESGFSRVFAAISPAIQVYLGELKKKGNLDRILVSGHSLGAAVGCLLSYSLSISFSNVNAILFAPPRSGDHLFMRAWGRRVNGRAVKFSLDPVTEVPCRTMPICDSKEDSVRKKMTETIASTFPNPQRTAARSPENEKGNSRHPRDVEDLKGLMKTKETNVGGTKGSGTENGLHSVWTDASQQYTLRDHHSRDRPLELLKYREEGSVTLNYADYPHSVVFTPEDLPNGNEQSTLHAKYNHFCSYSCWLTYKFNRKNPHTHCGKGSSKTHKHTPEQKEYDPSRCPAV